MGTSKQQGFTIIETVLFLGVSSLLLVLLVVGAGASLNAQRYKDAVQSFKSVVQAQYTELATIKNIRDNDWACDANAIATEGGDEFRGQAECLLVGKYMRIDRDDVRIYTVLARERTTPIGGLNDIQSLATNYALAASMANVERQQLDWGTAIAWPSGGSGSRSPTTPRTIGIFFARSPDSGTVYTFTSDSIPVDPDEIAQTTFTDLLVEGNTIPGRGARTICIISNGLIKTGDMAIYIKPYASSVSSVETRSNDFMLSQPGAVQC